MHQAGFEPTISSGQLPQTYDLDRSYIRNIFSKLMKVISHFHYLPQIRYIDTLSSYGQAIDSRIICSYYR
jgi:hypothetical protein